MKQRSLRKFHRIIAPIIFLPLFLTALTGVSYRVANSWLKTPNEVGEFLMYIHQGSFLGNDLRVFYVLLNALGVITMLITGILMTGLFRRQRSSD